MMDHSQHHNDTDMDVCGDVSSVSAVASMHHFISCAQSNIIHHHHHNHHQHFYYVQHVLITQFVSISESF